MPYHYFFPIAITVISTVAFTSPKVLAQTSSGIAPLSLTTGIYSRGVQHLQIVYSDGNTCIHGIFDSDVQTQALEAIEQIQTLSNTNNAEYKSPD